MNTLDHFFAIYVPSHTREGTPFDNTAVVEQVETSFAQTFGGSTSYLARGSWLTSNGALIQDNITVVKSFTTKEVFTKQTFHITSLAEELKIELNQEAVSLETQNGLTFV
jgi:hypothetical protein